MRALIRPPLALAAALLAATSAWAHGGHLHPAEAPGWTWDPLITVPIALSALLFAIGWRRLHARADRSQGELGRHAWCFATGWATLAAALVSPLHELGERSFAAHMFEHELLMLLAAPLLVLGRPLPVMLWAFPRRWRPAIGGVATGAAIGGSVSFLTRPAVATAIQAAALWLWHVPSLFDRALASEGWHAAQHLSFLASALIFWSAMLGRRGGLARNSGARALAALCLFVTSVISGALGALMAFSESPWYVGYARLGLAPLGLSPAEDQQLAGLIMWVPGGVVHAAAALILVRTLIAPPPRLPGELADAR